MILLIILGYVFISVLNAGIFGGLLAFILSRPGKVVSVWTLALGVLLFTVLSDLVMFAIVAPLKLTLTTANQFFIELFGSPDISNIFLPSFDEFDIGFYAFDVVVGTCIGRWVVTWKNKKLNFPTTV